MLNVRTLATYAWTHNTTPKVHNRRKTSPAIMAIPSGSSFDKLRHRRLASDCPPKPMFPLQEQSLTPTHSSSDDSDSHSHSSAESEHDDDSQYPGGKSSSDIGIPLISVDTSPPATAEARDIPHAHRRDPRVSAVHYEPMLEAGAVQPWLQQKLSLYFPSRLRQQLLLPSPLYKRPRLLRHRRQRRGAQVERSTAASMDTLAVLMPQNRFYCTYTVASFIF